MDSSDNFKSYEKDLKILGLRALDVFLLILVKSSKSNSSNFIYSVKQNIHALVINFIRIFPITPFENEQCTWVQLSI